MLVLSIKQPWAELILNGSKHIEHRNWCTSYRGEFLIHACRSLDQNGPWVLVDKTKMEYGCIIGRANLDDIIDYGNGTYGFLLSDVKRIKPIQASGNLYFWHYTGKQEIHEID